MNRPPVGGIGAKGNNITKIRQHTIKHTFRFFNAFWLGILIATVATEHDLQPCLGRSTTHAVKAKEGTSRKTNGRGRALSIDRKALLT